MQMTSDDMSDATPTSTCLALFKSEFVLVKLLSRCIFQFIVQNDKVNLVHSPWCVNK